MRPLGRINARLIFAASALAFAALTATAAPQSALAQVGADERLVYTPYTKQGDVLIDFSNCGYGGGGVALPQVAVKVELQPIPGFTKDEERIQAAIDEVSAMQPDLKGIRGAVLLRRGTYHLNKPVKILTSGVVLRGEGEGESGTLLVAEYRAPEALVKIGGGDGPRMTPGSTVDITDDYVPVGARSFIVKSIAGYTVGQKVFVIRRSNAAWLEAIGMNRITPRPTDPTSTKQWQPFDLKFDRVITAIKGNRITLDAPIGCAIDQRWGGGSLQRYEDPLRIERCGVESMSALSYYDTSKKQLQEKEMTEVDEEHATWFVEFGATKNSWARNLSTKKFAHGIALFTAASKWITVEDCSATEPVSLITGGRRYTYSIQGAQLVLVRRCYAKQARHAFVVGSRVAGPNAFVDCKAEQNYATSEPHERWSVAGLFDNVDSLIAFQDRQWMGSGHGWSGANYVAWNCRGTLVCQQPPTAQNFAIGFVGKKEAGAFAPRDPGFWESEGTHVAPRSLYEQQLLDRLGAKAVLN